MRGSVLVLGVLAALAAVPAMGAEAGAAERPAVAAARSEWRRLAERADGLRLAAHRARAHVSDPGTYFIRQARRIDARSEQVLDGLRGQPWAQVHAAMEEQARVRRALRELAREMAAWPRPLHAAPAREASGAATGTLSGRLIDARTGGPIREHVHIHNAQGSLVEFAHADENGAYASEGLAPGVYYVVTDAFTYNDELFNDIPCPDLGCDPVTGTPVTVQDGRNTPNVNFVLVPRASVAGTILDAAQLTPVPDVDVDLYDADGSWRGSARTGDDGTYVINRLLAGTYFAVAEDEVYLNQLYDGHPCQPECTPTSGTPILVGPGSVVTGIDFRLALGGKVSGRVVDGPSLAPLVSANVTVYDAAGDAIASNYTDLEGRYTVFDLPTGSVFVGVRESAHASELYDNIPCPSSCDPTSGTPVAVTAGQNRTGIDFSLTPLSAVAGRVTDGAGAPASGVNVVLVNGNGNYVGSRYTDLQGDWSVGGLSGGTYFAYTESDTFLDESYDNRPCEPTCSPTDGTPIVVPAGMSVGGINFQLVRGGWLTGSVRAQASGAPLDGARVDVYRSDGTFADSSYMTGGAFRVEGLTTGAYFAVAFNSTYLSELYRELPCASPSCVPTSGTPIAVTAAQATSGVDFTLNRLGRITGRVVDEVTGASVSGFARLYSGTDVVDTASYYQGFYSFEGVPPGTYRVVTDSYDNHVDELYDNRTCEPSCTVTQGAPVTAALDVTTPNIDFALRRPVFADVPVGHFAWRWAEALYMAGVTSGCATAPRRFCPDASTSRAEMAVFLLRSKEGTSYMPPPAQGLFADLPAANPFARWAEELFHRGVTGGCGTNPLRYCPDAATTRGQMAPFLLLTEEGSGYLPPPAVGVFQDLPPNDPFARWAEELVRRHVANGCSNSPPLYCPGQPTTRAQMAVFLGSTFGLPLP